MANRTVGPHEYPPPGGDRAAGPTYSALKAPVGRLHLDKESWKSWIEWEGKGIVASEFAVHTHSSDREHGYGTVTITIPLAWFEIVP